MTQTTTVSIGIATAPQQVTYQDVQRVWREADAIGEIEHAWLFDHLLPIAGDQKGPIFEGWTLLSALAAQTKRLRLGLLVTSNRIRPPAMLAKIAATVDIVSGGRLDFGIGAGSRTSIPWARREYDANGLPYHDAAYAVGSLGEACTVIRRLWTDDEPFDYDGTYIHLTGAYCNPKPVQRPYPPIIIGGSASATLRVVAEHADLWNIPSLDAAASSPAAPCSTASARRSAGTRPRSPGPSPSRSRMTIRAAPATRSRRPSRPASGTSSSACPPRIRTASRAGSPTRSSASPPSSLTIRTRPDGDGRAVPPPPATAARSR